MTEKAANRTMDLVEQSAPLVNDLGDEAKGLSVEWGKFMRREMGADAFRDLAKRIELFLARSERDSQKLSSQLNDILLAQDFQDLTGQVIKRMMDVIQEIERQLLMVLLENIPEPAARPKRENESLLNGPQLDASKAGVVASQDQVDDLLDSLGF